MALDMFGTMTRSITVVHPAPTLRAASDSVLMSMADRPASRARQLYGRTRMRYGNDSNRIESLMLILLQRLIGKMPTTSAIAGIVSGSRQRNSTIRFTEGILKRTQRSEEH